ncbi:transposase [Streptomyces boluensis]|uniref:Transposase n=1 Tax=Streptomyces boluensis TaxID=1775135 RepID=A0A964XIC4_9ACTN|nr:transposase [Streptomyces boluensis]NBE49900.1 transposase [Streptomyces boluensis]
MHWKRIEPLLPDRAPRRGGRWRDHRQVIDAIAFNYRTGCPWMDLPEEFGSWKGVHNRLRKWAADGSFSAGSLMSYPEPAWWQVHHSACNPSPDATTYAIEVHRCRSWADLVWWTVHLMGETWLRHTDWEDLFQEPAEAAETRISPTAAPKSHR